VKWLLKDSDAWLMLMLVIVGAMPVAADALCDRPLGVEATLGGVVAVSCAVALVRRAFTQLRAAAMLRRLRTTQ
jgi:hypothetical protein